MIIRHGAIGDAIMATAVIPYLRQEKYEIDFYTNERGREVVKHDPRIQNIIIHDENIAIEDLFEHWQKVGEPYDKVVNFHDLMENRVLFAYPQPEYFWPVRKRRELVGNKNYIDLHIERAGYKPQLGMRAPSLCLSKEETMKGKAWQRKHKNHFKVVWALAGSSIHKVWRYFEPCAREFLARHKDAWIFTVGDYSCKLLTFAHERVQNTMFWEMPFRDTMILTKYADLVVGPETGTIIAAGAFGTPVLCLLTHSSKYQVTGTFKNDYSVQAPTWCSPCHLLHKFAHIWRHVCQVGTNPDLPRCCEHGLGDVLEKMEQAYGLWKTRKTTQKAGIRS